MSFAQELVSRVSRNRNKCLHIHVSAMFRIYLMFGYHCLKLFESGNVLMLLSVSLSYYLFTGLDSAYYTMDEESNVCID